MQGQQNNNFNKSRKKLPGIIDSDRPMPFDLDAEKAVLAALMIDPQPCVDVAIEKFGSSPIFYHHAHQKIYDTIIKIFNDENMDVDFITLSHALEKDGCLEDIGGDLYLTEIENSIVTSANFESWCEIVLDYSMIRRMIGVCHTALDQCYNASEDVENILNQVEGSILKVREEQVESSIWAIKDLVKPAFKMIDDLYHQRQEPGIPTNYPGLDDKVNGLKPGDMFVLAARPSIGKTSFALNLVRNIAFGANPAGVAFFSLEMTELQIAVRLLCTEANISIKDVYDRAIKPKDLMQFTKAANELAKAPIYIDPTPALKVSQFRAKARRMKSRHDIKCIAIDYLQLMHPDKPSDSRQQDVSEISNAMKATAKELGVPIIVLAQLNRDIEKGGKGTTPKLSHLRESGAIEQDADVVAFLHRDRDDQKNITKEDQMKGIDAQLIIEKNRNGETGAVDLLFFPSRMLFTCKEHRYTEEDRPANQQ